MILPTGKLLFFVLQIATIAFIATDIYIPSLPAMQEYFKTTPELTQFSISIYLLSLSISQFFYGILSDRFGRKPMILIGLVISCIGSIFCVFAPSVHFLLFGRLIQGAGLGFSISIGRSIMPDVYSDKELVKMASYVAMSIPMVLMIAPVLGGYIQKYLGWRANFIFLLIYLFIFMILVYFYFPETNKHAGKYLLHPKTIFNHYKTLLTSSSYLGYTFCFSAAIASAIAYITASPFLLQKLVGLTPVEYGWTVTAVSGAGILGGYLNVKLSNHFSVFQLINLGGIGMLGSSLCLVFYGLHFPISLYSVVLPVMFYLAVARLSTTNAYLEGSKPFRHIMGTASTIFGGVQLLLGSIVSTIIAMLPETNQVPFGLVLVALALFSLLSVQLTKLKSKTEVI
jgi:DHA1 family 2-module integral membrane pump EmrD-like MFS transporter